MNILVLGASGGCGKEVVKQAITKGYKITSLVRETTSFDAPKGVDVIKGSVLDKETLSEAVQGKDIIFSCLGLNRTNKFNPWSKIVSPTNLMSKTVEFLSELLDPGTKLVVISAAGVAESFSKTNLVVRFLIKNSSLEPAYKDLEQMEDILAKSELDWYAVRPVTLTGFSLKETKESDFYGLFDMISRASVGSYILDLIDEKAQLENRTPIIKN